MHAENPMKSEPVAPTLRQNLQWAARALKQPLGGDADAGLALRLDKRASAVIAPGRNGMLVALFQIGPAEALPPSVWISALSEAAGWGLAGERQRFVVVDGQFTLLWTTPPLPEQALLEQMFDLMATAMALTEMTDSPAH